jgi:hypothetical protein
MAAATRVKARPCTPVGYEVVDKVELTVDVTAGDLLKYTGASNDGQAKVGLAAAGATEADGIALQDGYAGQRGFSMGIQGEMDGFSALTPGQALYPSGAVAGGLDTVAAGAIRVKSVKTTRIRYNFV